MQKLITKVVAFADRGGVATRRVCVCVCVCVCVKIPHRIPFVDGFCTNNCAQGFVCAFNLCTSL